MLPGPAERQARWQRILNERPIPSRHLQRIDRFPIPVTITVVWETDGVEVRRSEAYDWVGDDVLVDLQDDRRQTGGVWLDAGDITRR